MKSKPKTDKSYRKDLSLHEFQYDEKADKAFKMKYKRRERQRGKKQIKKEQNENDI